MTSTALAFLLITDFSGSMLQSFDKQIKVDLLRSQIQTLTDSLPSDKQTKIFVFGSKHQESCSQIQSFQLKTSALKKKLETLQPGNYGKTPLAKTLDIALNEAKETHTSDILVLTDGADTCQGDPCETLLAQDKKLSFRSKVRLMIVGYDLQSDQKKLLCLETLSSQLRHIELIYKNSHNLMDSNQALKSFAESVTQNQLPLASDGKFSIRGAPDFVQFIATSTSSPEIQRKWQGDFPILLPSGTYKLRNLTKNSKEITIQLRPRENHQIRFSETLLWTKVEIQGIPTGFEVIARPSPSVIEGFATPAERKLKSLAHENLEIGSWTLETTQPWWLEGVRFPVIVPLEDKNSLSINNLFQKNYNWILVPESAKYRILSLVQEDHEVRVLLPPSNPSEQKSLTPIPQGWFYSTQQEERSESHEFHPKD
jgi:hypothetical protein